MKAIVILALVALSGCVTSQSAPVDPLPSDYRQQIVAQVRKAFFDPYSIRDPSISAPMAWNDPIIGPASAVCVRANAKNRMGAYIGLRETAFIFRGGKIDVTDEEYTGVSCATAVYGPFPELEAGYQAPKPQARR